MGAIVKISSKNQIVIPKEIRKKLHINAGDELVLEMDNNRAVILPRPKKYSQYMLGLGSEVWQGIDATEYVKNERKSWGEWKKNF